MFWLSDLERSRFIRLGLGVCAGEGGGGSGSGVRVVEWSGKEEGMELQ
nr:hypothetical protein [Tanacetum cinerariifolium]